MFQISWIPPRQHNSNSGSGSSVEPGFKRKHGFRGRNTQTVNSVYHDKQGEDFAEEGCNVGFGITNSVQHGGVGFEDGFTKEEVNQLRSLLHKGASTNSSVNAVVTEVGES